MASEDWSQCQQWIDGAEWLEPVTGERVWIELVDGNTCGGRVVGWTRTEVSVQGVRLWHPRVASMARVYFLDRPRG